MTWMIENLHRLRLSTVCKPFLKSSVNWPVLSAEAFIKFGQSDSQTERLIYYTIPSFRRLALCSKKIMSVIVFVGDFKGISGWSRTITNCCTICHFFSSSPLLCEFRRSSSSAIMIIFLHLQFASAGYHPSTCSRVNRCSFIFFFVLNRLLFCSQRIVLS